MKASGEQRLFISGFFLLGLLFSFAWVQSAKTPFRKWIGIWEKDTAAEEQDSKKVPTFSGKLSLDHPHPEILEMEFWDPEGKRLSLGDLKTGFKLVFFGSLYASEITPLALGVMSRMRELHFLFPLDFLFFTLDPQRDTEKILQSYAQFYKGQILFLKGKNEDIFHLAHLFGVRFQKTPLENSLLEASLDQSAWIYFTTPDYRILAAYPTQIRWERLKMEIDAHIKNFRSGRAR